MDPDVDIPEQASYGESFSEALNTQLQKLPEIYAAKRQYDPRFQELNQDQTRQGMAFLADLYGGSGTSDALDSEGAGAVFSDIQAGIRESDFLNNKKLMETYGADAREIYRENNPLFALLEDQAMDELNNAGSMTERDRTEIMDPILAQYAAAGRVFDDDAIEAAVQGTLAAQDRRKAGARNFAFTIAQKDPFLELTQPSGGQNLAMSQQQFAGAFDPGELLNPAAGQQYISDAYTNKTNQAIGEANAKANYWGGMFSAAADIGAAALTGGASLPFSAARRAGGQ
jgi:hypothetical protein